VAIRTSFTHPRTGAVSPEAHLIVDNPILDAATRQVVQRVVVYASEADYEAGREPVWRYERTLESPQYTTARTLLMNAVEPVLITRFFPGGTRVPD
jgi:hypothetical protein